MSLASGFTPGQSRFKVVLGIRIGKIQMQVHAIITVFPLSTHIQTEKCSWWHLGRKQSHSSPGHWEFHDLFKVPVDDMNPGSHSKSMFKKVTDLP